MDIFLVWSLKGEATMGEAGMALLTGLDCVDVEICREGDIVGSFVWKAAS